MKLIKYFFEFTIIISLFCIFKIIGLRNASNLGGFLGKLFGPLFRSKGLVKENIKIGLGSLSKNEEEKIINGMWSNIGRTFAEYVFIKDFKLNQTGYEHMKIIGGEHLDEIKKSNKPVIFYSGHFSNFELMMMELEKSGIRTAAIYRPLNNLFLDPALQYFRMKYICSNYIPKGRAAMREVIKKITNNYSIALMVDQRVGEGKIVNFFNQPAQTTTIPAQLALRYNCKLVPISLKRIENTNFEMTVHQPYEVVKTGNDEEDTQSITLKINKIIEKMVIDNPSQWLWSHNRWKK